VSPFGGEADICPREESSSYYFVDFQGTSVHLSHENIYRVSKALFPPNPEILKAMCFRGYKDAISFLKARSDCLIKYNLYDYPVLKLKNIENK
jgi:patatin-like phospholipase domain-containing protein 2